MRLEILCYLVKLNMMQKNKQFYIKLIVFICILIVGIILILVDNLIIKVTLLGDATYNSAYGYLTIVAGFIIFLGVMIIIRGLLLLRRARQQDI